MTGSRVALVAEDMRFAAAVGAHIEACLGHTPLVCGFANVRQHLDRDTNGMLLLAAVRAADGESVVRLVQEIYLQKLPPVIALIEAETLPEHEEFTLLEPYVAERLRWPDESRRLAEWIRDRLHRMRPFPAGTEGVQDYIRRKLVTLTPSLLPLTQRLALVAQHDVTVLLTGETGTGKTFLARLMHDCSSRRDHPFVVVPCGAMPPSLIESAFFGHVRGAFTGADRARDGKFAAAGQGTILLDEIDTLAPEQQAGLLRVIETGEYEPVGSNETQVSRARIIVTSNVNLEEAVAHGRLREDLYYRLNVMSFHLPPLRERIADIAPLVRGMAARYNTKFRKSLFDVSREAMDLLEAYPWPGNIRQLENFTQQAVLISGGPELLPEHLPDPVREYLPNPDVRWSSSSLSRNRELNERTMIQRTLAENNNSRTRTARELGISRVTLYKKMRKYGLLEEPPAKGAV